MAMADSQIAHAPTVSAAADPPRASDRLAAGDVAGDYVVDRFLGSGAMGDVYAGHHPVIGKRVAIKVLKRELAADPEAAERFVREARAVNQIDHPNVIDVFNFGRLPDGRMYLVMDLVDGHSLRKAMQDGALAADAALDVLAKIAAALDAAHARGVVHRDLKPDNVMLSDSTPPEVYVLDFGIAKLATSAGGGIDKTLTAKGTWLGTPGYMAPEQWSADGAGPASDRYALGVMAYELLSGALPFQAPTLPQMMEQHFRAPVPALSSRGAIAHDDTLDPVLAKAMAKAPGERFATARELIDALRTASAGASAVPAKPRTAKLALPALAGIGVLGLAVVGFVVVRDTNDAADPDVRGAPVRPAEDFAQIQIVTQPAGATVWRDGKRVGISPVAVEARADAIASLTIQITKPGYRSIAIGDLHAKAGAAIEVVKALEPITAFEGVWAMPDGQLRSFKRVGERVDVFKLATVASAGEFWRRFEFVDPPADEPAVVFATNAELTDERGVRDPSCQISHNIAYQFDPKAETLIVRAERVETARQEGHCIVRQRLPGTPVALIRADRATDDTRWTQPPVGKPPIPVKRPNKKLSQAPKVVPAKPTNVRVPKPQPTQANVVPANANNVDASGDAQVPNPPKQLAPKQKAPKQRDLNLPQQAPLNGDAQQAN